jgi:hypothetical protein
VRRYDIELERMSQVEKEDLVETVNDFNSDVQLIKSKKKVIDESWLKRFKKKFVREYGIGGDDLEKKLYLVKLKHHQKEKDKWKRKVTEEGIGRNW